MIIINVIIDFYSDYGMNLRKKKVRLNKKNEFSKNEIKW